MNMSEWNRMDSIILFVHTPTRRPTPSFHSSQKRASVGMNWETLTLIGQTNILIGTIH